MEKNITLGNDAEEKMLKDEYARNKYAQSIGNDKKASAFLERIKKVNMIEGFDCLTSNMIASYLNVDAAVIRETYAKYLFEFDDCISIETTPLCTLFTPSAIVRFAMLIKHSSASQTIRQELITQYQNV